MIHERSHCATHSTARCDGSLHNSASSAPRQAHEGPTVVSPPPFLAFALPNHARTARRGKRRPTEFGTAEESPMATQPDTDSSSPIDVAREPENSGKERRKRGRQWDRNGEEFKELSERMRDAVLRQRVLEGIGERLEGAVRDRVRDVLKQRFARDLRRALRDVALSKADPGAVSDLLSDQLSDAIEDRVVDALREQLGGALRE